MSTTLLTAATMAAVIGAQADDSTNRDSNTQAKYSNDELVSAKRIYDLQRGGHVNGIFVMCYDGYEFMFGKRRGSYKDAMTMVQVMTAYQHCEGCAPVMIPKECSSE